MHATREELVEADEVGERIADAILEYFADAANLDIIRRLREAGLQFETAARELTSETLVGKSFVVSGRFSRSRDEMKALIEAHGGKNLAAVSGNVDYIVAGENMGPAKLKKAGKLGIRILSEEEFLRMIDGDGSPEADAAAEDEGLATAGGGKTAEPAPEPTAGGAKTAASESAGQAPRQGELF